MTAPAYIRHEKLVHLVIRRHFMWMIRLGYCMDDMVQEGRIAIWRAEKEYTPEKGRETTYYARCVYNRLHHVFVWPHQSQKRMSDRLTVPITQRVGGEDGDELTLLDTLVAQDANPADVAIDRALADAYVRKIARNPRQTEAIRLRYKAGLDLNDVGRAMGISRQAAQQMIGRALEAMRA